MADVPGLALIACETCGSAERELRGQTGGERLLEELRNARAAGVGPEIALSSVRCLWACSRSCAVHLRAAGRPGYVLVGFEPSADAARALLEYAALYASSEQGAVPYKHWPTGVRGHFLCRVPALPELPVAAVPAEQPNPEREA